VLPFSPASAHVALSDNGKLSTWQFDALRSVLLLSMTQFNYAAATVTVSHNGASTAARFAVPVPGAAPAGWQEPDVLLNDYSVLRALAPVNRTTLALPGKGNESALLALGLYTYLPGSGYCEAVRLGGPIAQPANAWSSLAFLAAGAHMLARAAADVAEAAGGARLEMQRHPHFGLLNGLAQALSGIGSFLFHASEGSTWTTRFAHSLDMFAIYVMLLTVTAYTAQRAARVARPRVLFVALLAAGTTVFCALTASSALAGTPAVGLLSGVMVATTAAWAWLLGSPLAEQAGLPDTAAPAEPACGSDRLSALSRCLARERAVRCRALPRLHLPYAAAAAACIAVAFAARQLEAPGRRDQGTRLGCWPHSFFQLHGVWHVAAAACFWWLWLFLRSESAEDRLTEGCALLLDGRQIKAKALAEAPAASEEEAEAARSGLLTPRGGAHLRTRSLDVLAFVQLAELK
jgi:hypothetical protein